MPGAADFELVDATGRFLVRRVLHWRSADDPEPTLPRLTAREWYVNFDRVGAPGIQPVRRVLHWAQRPCHPGGAWEIDGSRDAAVEDTGSAPKPSTGCRGEL